MSFAQADKSVDISFKTARIERFLIQGEIIAFPFTRNCDRTDLDYCRQSVQLSVE
jgi:hypothetical protein